MTEADNNGYVDPDPWGAVRIPGLLLSGFALGVLGTISGVIPACIAFPGSIVVAAGVEAGYEQWRNERELNKRLEIRHGRYN